MADASERNVEELVAELAHEDAVVRQKARTALVNVGSASVPPLLTALDHSQQHVRWEAAKALTDIPHLSAAERLVGALSDRDDDVRWVAGEALIALRSDAVRPLLHALTQSEPPAGLYRGAHHVLHELVNRGIVADSLSPVLEALDEPEPDMAVPLAASKALKEPGI